MAPWFQIVALCVSGAGALVCTVILAADLSALVRRRGSLRTRLWRVVCMLVEAGAVALAVKVFLAAV